MRDGRRPPESAPLGLGGHPRPVGGGTRKGFDETRNGSSTNRGRVDVAFSFSFHVVSMERVTSRCGFFVETGRSVVPFGVHTVVPSWDGRRRRSGFRPSRARSEDGRARSDRSRSGRRHIGNGAATNRGSSDVPVSFPRDLVGRPARATGSWTSSRRKPASAAARVHDFVPRRDVRRLFTGRARQREPVVTVSNVARAVPIRVPTEASIGSHRSRSGRRARRTSNSRFSAM